MNASNANDWLKYHGTLNNDFGGWMKSLTLSELEDFVSATEGALRDTDFAEAKHASDLMFAGDLERPFAFSQHVAVIREFCLPPPPSTRQRTLGELEEERRLAREVQPLAPAFRELLESLGRRKETRNDEVGPQSYEPGGAMKCPYCEGLVILVGGIGSCVDCGSAVHPDGVRLPFEEAQLARLYGTRRREARKHKSLARSK